MSECDKVQRIKMDGFGGNNVRRIPCPVAILCYAALEILC
jgi:hypothetical protein